MIVSPRPIANFSAHAVRTLDSLLRPERDFPMADELKPDVTETSASAIVESIGSLEAAMTSLAKGMEDMDAKIEERSKVQQASWLGGKAPGLVIGESSLSSRPFSYSRLALGLQKQRQNDDSWKDDAKLEMRFSADVGRRSGFVCAVPIGAEFMSEDNGLSDLRKEWTDMDTNLKGFDPEEAKWLLSKLEKSMSFRTHETGGTLVDFPQQGELIDLLRANSIFGQIPGISNVQLPQQGSIRYPRITSGVTVSSYAELETTSDSDIGTDEVLLEARKYAGMVKLSEEFMKFATSVASDAFVRGEMTQDINLQVDRDIIDGGGGKRIVGLINYSGITSHDAATPGTDGDTLGSEDLDYLMAKIADANVPTSSGFFFACINRLWAALKHRKDDQGRGVFDVSASSFGGGRVQKQMSGEPVYTSTNIPSTRVKGSSGAALTLVLAGVPGELYLGRAGAMEIKMTDSDSSDFTQGKFTLRGVHYVDAVPKHAESFGLIDQLVIG